MEKRKHIFWELVLIFGSVLVFRGIWHWIDKFSFGNSILFLTISTLLGAVLMIEGYLRLVHSDRSNHH